MLIPALIFDFDGVIFNSEHWHLEACNQVLKTHFGFEISHQEYFQKYAGVPDLDFAFRVLSHQGLPPETLTPELFKKIMRQKTEVYKQIILDQKSLTPVPGLPEFLQKISKHTDKIGICSASRKVELLLALSKLNQGELQPYFKIITTLDDVVKGKPSPEGYLKTAGLLAVPPEKCIVIEDSPTGTAAAKAANMYVIGLLTTHSPEELKEANTTALDYSEVWQKITTR